MTPIPGFTYFPLQFDKKGRMTKSAEAAALVSHLDSEGVTDLLVLSHGWNNDMQEADELYANLLRNMRTHVDSATVAGAAGRKFAVVGVLWPSKKFADEELIPSGAAGVVNTVAADTLREQIEQLRGGFDAPNADETLDEMKKLLPKLEDSHAARREFVELACSLVQTDARDEEDQSNEFFGMQPLQVFERLEQPASFVAEQPLPMESEGGAAGFEPSEGGAAGFKDFFSGVFSGARNVLNYTTYYQMKARAGVVGAEGLNPFLRRIRSGHPQLRIHLVGHSFGGRLVSAAAAGPDEQSTLQASSISLLQAAFSHHGFAKNWDGKGTNGFFRRVIDKRAISGPFVITFSKHDRAVGLAYPIASLLAGQDSAGLGDKESRFGGIGRNGAQRTAEAIEMEMLAAGAPYSFTSGKLHNLNSDRTISNHGDVSNSTVAYAVLSAIAAT